VLVAAALCPHPPLLVPAVAGRAAPEMEGCRSACASVVGALAAARPDRLVVVGGGDTTRRHEAHEVGSLACVGVDVRWTLAGGPAAATAPTSLPLSLTVASWLLGSVGGHAPLTGQQVRTDAPPQECLDLGAALAASAPRVALLVMADLSARRSPSAPGYLDPRAVPFDDAVERALAAGDEAALAALDPELARDLLVGGRAALQVLAGAGPLGPAQVHAALDPYGVRYVVASWSPTP
jgi:hypothetical protein